MSKYSSLDYRLVMNLMNLDQKDIDIPVDPEDTRLLKKEATDDHVRECTGNPVLDRTARIQISAHIVVLYCIIVGLIVAFLAVFNTPFTCRDPSQGIYSPAAEAVEYHTLVFHENFVTKGPYMGRPDDVADAGIPNDETDALWEDLFNFGVSQIPLSQARLLPNATELIPGTDDQYIIELDVFHQLHCLNAVRKSLYPERYWNTYEDYYINDGSAPGRGERNYTSTDAKHLDHCVDAIRQSIMCHGDIATVYWRWFEPREVPLPRLDVTHTCRNFDKLRDWGMQHQVTVNPRWYRAPESTFHQSC